MMCTENDLPFWIAVLISMTNLTSAGQFAGTALIINGGSLFEIGLTTFVINIRYLLMSLSLSQRIDPALSIPKRLVMSFGVTDEIFGVSMQAKGQISAAYFIGLMTAPFWGWALGTLIGATAVSLLPDMVRSALGIADKHSAQCDNQQSFLFVGQKDCCCHTCYGGIVDCRIGRCVCRVCDRTAVGLCAHAVIEKVTQILFLFVKPLVFDCVTYGFQIEKAICRLHKGNTYRLFTAECKENCELLYKYLLASLRALDSIERICYALECGVDDILEFIADDKEKKDHD